MPQRIQIRNGSAAEWIAVNPVLAAGEPGLESDTKRIKYGDGTTAWSSLHYAGESASTKTIMFYIGETLQVETNAMSAIVPQAMTITAIRADVDIAPIGSSLILDINKNGSTIYSTQANRPEIISGDEFIVATLPDTTVLDKYDKLTLDIDQIGSVTEGINLCVAVICEVI
jgi:hypothetical protein